MGGAQVAFCLAGQVGAKRVGPFGLGQVIADTIKLFFKEDWVPPFSDKPVFILPRYSYDNNIADICCCPFWPGFLCI